jgi:hypothetical protein
MPRTRAGVEDAAAAATVVTAEEASTLTLLPDLTTCWRWYRAGSLLAARCACRLWRDLTVAPQLLRLRREGPHVATTPCLFLFGVEGDGGWGGTSTASVHALDMAVQRWRRVRAAALRGRSLFSVIGLGDKLYVGGRSRGSAARTVKGPRRTRDRGVQPAHRGVAEGRADAGG